jgi:hypothetical protein
LERVDRGLSRAITIIFTLAAAPRAMNPGRRARPTADASKKSEDMKATTRAAASAGATFVSATPSNQRGLREFRITNSLQIAFTLN